MILGRCAALAAACLALPAAACPPPDPTLLFHSCRGPSAAALLLLPEETPEPEPAWATGVRMTGGYTGRDRRAGDLPAPVGLFLHRGEVVTPHMAPMDGILLVEDGRPSLHHRQRVAFAGQRYDLTDLGERAAFVAAARTAGVSVLQSHLLIVEGAVDVRPREDAPRFVRRVLFEGPGGFGVWESPEPMTLHAATEALAAAHAPRWALNLDMGSHDYCWAWNDGAVSRCGYRGRSDLTGLSNLLVLRRTGG